MEGHNRVASGQGPSAQLQQRGWSAGKTVLRDSWAIRFMGVSRVVVAALEKEDLEGAAGLTAWQLREGGIAVDLVLGAKKLKFEILCFDMNRQCRVSRLHHRWVFKHAHRLGAPTLVLIASEEWGDPQGYNVTCC